MSAAHKIKVNETPTLQWTLGRDITGCAVRLLVALSTAPFTNKIDATATIVTASTGIISYAIGATTLPAGTYNVEVRTTLAGVVLAYPSVGFSQIVVAAGLG